MDPQVGSRAGDPSFKILIPAFKLSREAPVAVGTYTGCVRTALQYGSYVPTALPPGIC